MNEPPPRRKFPRGPLPRRSVPNKPLASLGLFLFFLTLGQEPPLGQRPSLLSPWGVRTTCTPGDTEILVWKGIPMRQNPRQKFLEWSYVPSLESGGVAAFGAPSPGPFFELYSSSVRVRSTLRSHTGEMIWERFSPRHS